MMSEKRSTELAVDVRSVSKWYGRKPALHDLSLAIPRGGVHAVVGRNGAGKSTLFRILLGFEHPSAGSTRVLGADSRMLPTALRGDIALVNEEHALPPWLHADRLCAMQRDLHPRWDQAVFDDIVDLFDLSLAHRISQLSRGERAGICLALALAQRPRLLILDEPTLGLDVVANQAIVEALLIASTQEDCTQLFCSHQMDEVERLADNLILIEQGKLGACAAPDVFRERFSAWTADGLAAERLVTVQGLLRHRVIEGRHHLVAIDRDDAFAEELRALGGENIARGPISFDRAVNAFLQGRVH